MKPTRLFEFIEYQNQNAPLEKAFTTKYEAVKNISELPQIASRTLLDLFGVSSSLLLIRCIGPLFTNIL